MYVNMPVCQLVKVSVGVCELSECVYVCVRAHSETHVHVSEGSWKTRPWIPAGDMGSIS